MARVGHPLRQTRCRLPRSSGPTRRHALASPIIRHALVLTGYISATIGNANRITAIVRVTLGGLAAMAATYAIGTLIGHALT